MNGVKVMENMKLLKSTIIAASLGTGIFVSPTVAHAGYNLCAISTVPESVIRQTIRHAEFENVLAKMVVVCPVSALALTEAATAAVSNGEPSDGIGHDGGPNGTPNDPGDPGTTGGECGDEGEGGVQ